MSDVMVGGGIIAAVSALLVLIVVIIQFDGKKWERFVAENNCKIVGKDRGSTSFGVGVGTNGQVTMMPITTPSKTGWLCKDGVTYWR